jgi:hypothetical protein
VHRRAVGPRRQLGLVASGCHCHTGCHWQWMPRPREQQAPLIWLAMLCHSLLTQVVRGIKEAARESQCAPTRTRQALKSLEALKSRVAP